MSSKLKIIPPNPFDLIQSRFSDKRRLSEIPTDEWSATLDAIFPATPIVTDKKEDK